MLNLNCFLLLEVALNAWGEGCHTTSIWGDPLSLNRHCSRGLLLGQATVIRNLNLSLLLTLAPVCGWASDPCDFSFWDVGRRTILSLWDMALSWWRERVSTQVRNSNNSKQLPLRAATHISLAKARVMFLSFVITIWQDLCEERRKKN